MKNKFIIFYALAIILFFTSCTSLTSKSGFVCYPEENTNYSIQINKVSVSNDKVIDSDVENQIFTIFESIFGKSQLENTTSLKLDVEIIQRSFFYKIEQKNSIYVSYILYNADKIIMQKGFYIETADTIISSREQYRISNMISKDIQAFVKKSSTLYKEKK